MSYKLLSMLAFVLALNLLVGHGLAFNTGLLYCQDFHL